MLDGEWWVVTNEADGQMGRWAVGGENFGACGRALSAQGGAKMRADQSDELFGAYSEIFTLQPTFSFSLPAHGLRLLW